VKKENGAGFKGFTLIELLIAVSIFATVALVLYSTFRGGVVSWQRVDSEFAVHQKIRYVLDRMSVDFKNMVFISNVPFEGLPDKVLCTPLLRSEDGTGLRVARVGYYVSFDEDDKTQGSLLRSDEPIKQALVVDVEEDSEQEEAESEEEEADTKEKVLENISEISFKYLHALEAEEEEAEEGPTYEWVDSWDTEYGHPVGIEVSLILIDPEDKATIELSKRIFVPIGGPNEE